MAKKRKRGQQQRARAEAQGQAQAATPQNQQASQAAAERRAQQLKEWQARKKQKERKDASIAPILWTVGGAGGLIGAVVLAIVLLTGGGGDGSGSAATPTRDPRVGAGDPAETFEIIADDQGQSINPTFDPTVINAAARDIIELKLVNVGTVAHNLNVSGIDKEYGTPDDFVIDAIDPGEESSLFVKLNDPGTYPYRCDLHPLQQIGNLILQ